jgi:hypothetical glycosyl hydrolase
LRILAPIHDSRCGIAAKGLSGEGYKGHSFWDTEVFVLPYFIFVHPAAARGLLEYRHRTLPGARRKARDNGYRGAMFAWESARAGEETAPVWGAADILTGRATKIWTGFIEQHVTADVAWAVNRYYEATGDWQFMAHCGLEILFETATFWASRVEVSDRARGLEITDVIGPDEYKEHVDNNAFTNHMAHHNLDLAAEFYQRLKSTGVGIPDHLKAIANDESLESWRQTRDRLYLPAPNAEGVIPQDDTYMGKRQIDLTRYRNQETAGSIGADYNMELINEIQVTKQADVLALMYLLERDFPLSIKRANWEFYEPRTLHDSSLSLSVHTVLACDMGDQALAEKLWGAASRIDLGPAMTSSDAGIHAASLGGIWQAVVMGFGGFRLLGDKVRLDPLLPAGWEQLRYEVRVRYVHLKVTVGRDTINVDSENPDDPLVVICSGREYTLTDSLTINR